MRTVGGGAEDDEGEKELEAASDEDDGVEHRGGCFTEALRRARRRLSRRVTRMVAIQGLQGKTARFAYAQLATTVLGGE